MLIVICVGQDLSKCTGTGFYTLENKTKPLVLKELKKLWDDLPWRQQGEFSPSNTLLLDDSPYKALRNPVRTAFAFVLLQIPLAATTSDACLLRSRTPPFSLAPIATRTTRTTHWVRTQIIILYYIS